MSNPPIGGTFSGSNCAKKPLYCPDGGRWGNTLIGALHVYALYALITRIQNPCIYDVYRQYRECQDKLAAVSIDKYDGKIRRCLVDFLCHEAASHLSADTADYLATCSYLLKCSVLFHMLRLYDL